MQNEGASSTGRRGLWACVAMGAVIRVAFVATKWGDKLQLNDSWYYSAQARQLAHGVWFREMFADQPGAEHGPLTSMLMAPVSYTAHYHDFQRLVTVVTGVALIWVLGRFVEDLAGATAGVVAALITAVYPNMWMNDGLIMSESISMLLVALSMWAAWRAARSTSMRSMALLGCLVGLGLLARSELVLFAPLLLLWTVVARRRAARPARPVWVAAGCALLVVLPWVTFNLVRFEKPVFLTTNDGTTLLGANCPRTYSGTHLGGWVVFCISDDPQYSPDEEPSVRSARHRSMGIDYALHHTDRWPAVVAARLGRTLDLYAVEDTIFQDLGEGRPRLMSWLAVPLFWALAVASVFGALRMRRRDRTLLLVPVLVVLVATVLFYGAHRIRSSAEPSLVAFTAVAIAGWVTAKEPERS